MALVEIQPVEAQVRWDRHTNRPTEIRWAGRQLQVVALSSVRDERAAYPAARGPRVRLLLETRGGGHAALVYDGRQGRWFVEALDEVA
jgi:hypothetical protein